jgi:hypothetical protein
MEVSIPDPDADTVLFDGKDYLCKSIENTGLSFAVARFDDSILEAVTEPTVFHHLSAF